MWCTHFFMFASIWICFFFWIMYTCLCICYFRVILWLEYFRSHDIHISITLNLFLNLISLSYRSVQYSRSVLDEIMTAYALVGGRSDNNSLFVVSYHIHEKRLFGKASSNVYLLQYWMLWLNCENAKRGLYYNNISVQRMFNNSKLRSSCLSDITQLVARYVKFVHRLWHICLFPLHKFSLTNLQLWGLYC
jgi:hypothetical protein